MISDRTRFLVNLEIELKELKKKCDFPMDSCRNQEEIKCQLHYLRPQE